MILNQLMCTCIFLCFWWSIIIREQRRTQLKQIPLQHMLHSSILWCSDNWWRISLSCSIVYICIITGRTHYVFVVSNCWHKTNNIWGLWIKLWKFDWQPLKEFEACRPFQIYQSAIDFVLNCSGLPWKLQHRVVNLKWPACSEFLWSPSLATIILKMLYWWFQHWFSWKMLKEWSSNLVKR